MNTRYLNRRLDRLVREGAYGSTRCVACRSSDPEALDGLLRIRSPLLGPGGECLLNCTHCRQLYRGHVFYENGMTLVDNVRQLHMPN